MKITDERVKKETSLQDVEVGKVFLYEEIPFMKTDEMDEDGETYCANLLTGRLEIFSQNNTVEKCIADLRIRGTI